MSLEISRQQLLSHIQQGKINNEQETFRLMDEWWRNYKAWEMNDDFLSAFLNFRMTIRQTHPTNVYKDEFYARPLSEEPGGKVETYHGYSYDVSIAGIKKRLAPDNFGIEQGERLKYKNGLHDLSGTLLNPFKPLITRQLRWKHGKLKNWVAVFMPLSKQEDLRLINVLNQAFKSVKVRKEMPVLYGKLSSIKRRMTRIKLAENDDMKANFINIAPEGERPKFRYGQKLPPKGGVLQDFDMKRFNKTMDYEALVGSGENNYNEIIIAYRQHASNRFPLFAKWDSVEQAFVLEESEATSRSIISMINGKRVIPDGWVNTVQT